MSSIPSKKSDFKVGDHVEGVSASRMVRGRVLAIQTSQSHLDFGRKSVVIKQERGTIRNVYVENCRHTEEHKESLIKKEKANEDRIFEMELAEKELAIKKNSVETKSKHTGTW